MQKPVLETENESRQKLFDALAVALTPRVRSSVGHFAYRRYTMLKHAGVMVDEPFTRQIVADVVTDTAIGRLTWDPQRVKLSTHLCGAIKSRTHQMLLRHRKHAHISLSPPSQEVHDLNATESNMEAEASLAQGEDPRVTIANDNEVAQLRASLRAACLDRGDTVALQLLDNYTNDYGYRRDLVALGLSSRAHDAARKRLLRLAKQLASAHDTEPGRPQST